MTKHIAVPGDLLEQIAKCLDSTIELKQNDFDQPPEPATEWDFNAAQLVWELRALLDGPGVEPVAFIQVFQSALDYVPGDWFRAQSVDEMEGFYWARLPAIRAAAKECGYAVAVHGSTRRDFDLLAMPWRDGAADKDDLAHAMQKAACGMTREGPYTWEQKPVGRVATSFPICTTAWHDMISAGHVDLSIIAAPSAPAPAVHLSDILDGILERRKLVPAQAVPDEFCTWKPIDDEFMPGTYEGSCGAAWTFNDGGVVENDMHYCPQCGRKLIAAAPQPPTPADDQGPFSKSRLKRLVAQVFGEGWQIVPPTQTTEEK